MIKNIVPIKIIVNVIRPARNIFHAFLKIILIFGKMNISLLAIAFKPSINIGKYNNGPNKRNKLEIKKIIELKKNNKLLPVGFCKSNNKI
tara:strand:+ start:55 stop:324 length:270 start_codon:yes stop_codon:yes gene_type:complete